MATSIREGMDQGGVAHEIIALVQERSNLDLMFEAGDKDGSGSIDFEEFAKMSCHVGMLLGYRIVCFFLLCQHCCANIAVPTLLRQHCCANIAVPTLLCQHERVMMTLLSHHRSMASS